MKNLANILEIISIFPNDELWFKNNLLLLQTEKPHRNKTVESTRELNWF